MNCYLKTRQQRDAIKCKEKCAASLLAHRAGRGVEGEPVGGLRKGMTGSCIPEQFVIFIVSFPRTVQLTTC